MIRHCAAFLSDQDVAHLFDGINKMLGRGYFVLQGEDAHVRMLPHEVFSCMTVHFHHLYHHDSSTHGQCDMHGRRRPYIQ